MAPNVLSVLAVGENTEDNECVKKKKKKKNKSCKYIYKKKVILLSDKRRWKVISNSSVLKLFRDDDFKTGFSKCFLFFSIVRFNAVGHNYECKNIDFLIKSIIGTCNDIYFYTIRVVRTIRTTNT